MEDWLYYSLAVTFCLTVSALLSSRRRPSTGKQPSLPPGPAGLSVVGPLLFIGWTSFGIDLIVRAARRRYGPVFTLHLLPNPVVFISDHTVARRVLVQGGAAFADRPPANLATRVFSSNQHNITSSAYGPLWSALRRNLTGKVLHPSYLLRRYAAARLDAVAGLIAGVERQRRSNYGGVVVVEGLLHHAIFHVFVRMCFGEECLSDDDVGGVVAAVTALQREFLTSVVGFQVFSVVPAVTKLVYRRRWEKMMSIRRRQEELFIPLIRARRDAAAGEVDCYADSLLGLRIPNEDGGTRNLTEREMVSLCSEFLAGGTDSTVAVMQWTMAEVVAHPEIQAKLRAEIHDVVNSGSGADELYAEHEHLLPRMPYLRAVVLEGLRRHPPGRFMLPHAATAESGATFDGFAVPRHAMVNFALGGMAMDEAVWRAPASEFRPDRFMPGGEGEDIDLTGAREIKMMPFGAGRRVCPGIDAAMLHLEYFIASLVREFEWREVPGEKVDFAERQEMSVVMRRPLRAKVVPCMNKN